MKLLLLILLASLAYAGQSIEVSATASIPTVSTSSDVRVECMWHGWSNVGGTARKCRVSAAGIDPYIASSTLVVAVPGVNGLSGAITFNVSAYTTFLNMRIMLDQSAQTLTVELWDINGTRVAVESRTFTSINTGSWTTGADSQGGAQGGATAFFRILDSLVPLNSRPPVTFDNDASRLYEWKFDGSLTAAVGGVDMTAASPTYITSIGQNAFSLPKVNATEWSNWTSVRAGTSQTLTGSASYSQADDSNTVSCFWQILSAPTGAPLPTLSSHTVCDPTITGTVFGSYEAQLTVTATSGNVNLATLEFGAVATDSNGVVVSQYPEIENVLGPMIAFGRNPWGYADDAHLRGMAVRNTTYDTVSPPEWVIDLPGTVSYVANTTTRKGTLNGAISDTDTTITLVTGHSLSLTDFPTVISIGAAPGGGSSSEQILICSAAGDVLTVCFGGRGWMGTTPRSGSDGGAVFQNKATGTSTQFLTDFCPGGGPGPEGTLNYNTGTLTATAGSTTVTGSGTSWSNGNGVFTGRFIRIEGTHSGGTPFIHLTTIATINSTTQITLSRAFPAGADTASGLTYQVITSAQRSFSPHWTRPDATEGQTVYTGQGSCVSNTSLYFAGGLEVTTGTQTNKNYSYMSGFWMTSGGNGTPNFYDEVLANYALWLRSGYEPARTAARKIGDYWLTQPLLDEGWGEPFPRNVSEAGVVLAALVDGKSDNWIGIRKLAEKGVSATTNTDCTSDTRENAYRLMWLAFAANYDPLDTGNPAEPGQRSYWKAKLVDSYNRDNGCKRADNSYSNGSQWGASSAMTATNGSKVVTGSGFTSATCNWTASGTGTIVSGAGSFTVTAGTLVAGSKVLIAGTRSGQPYNVYYQFSGTTGTVQLSGTWLGDTGAIAWQTESDGHWTVWHDGPTLTDGDQGKLYGCRFVSSTELELNRNYAEPSTTDLRRFRSNLAGWGQQPFIMGIKAWQMSIAAQGADAPTSSNYQTLAEGAATWVRTTGYDSITQGLFYGRIYQQCEPVVGAGDFTWATMRQNECNYTAGNRGAARALNAEAQNALRLWYEANPTAPNQATGDEFYAASWGYKYVAPGYATDSYDNIYATTANLNAGKWYGFQFGVGMAHQWPAVRVGGVAPEDLRTIAVSSRLADVSGAVSIKVTATRPNGTTSTATCTTGACSVTVDARQGTQWLLTIEYYDGAAGTGKRLAAGTQEASL